MVRSLSLYINASHLSSVLSSVIFFFSLKSHNSFGALSYHVAPAAFINTDLHHIIHTEQMRISKFLLFFPVNSFSITLLLLLLFGPSSFNLIFSSSSCFVQSINSALPKHSLYWLVWNPVSLYAIQASVDVFSCRLPLLIYDLGNFWTLGNTGLLG